MSREGNRASRLSFFIQALSAIFALAAAVFWLGASIDAAPESVAAAMKSRGGMDVFGDDLKTVLASLIHQGRLNAYAAGCAACAAVLQAADIVLRQPCFGRACTSILAFARSIILRCP